MIALSSLSGSLSDHYPPTMPPVQSYSIQEQTYTLIDTGRGVLGKGAFGTVLKATGRDDQLYALKKIQFTISRPEERNEVMREAQISVALSHKNVLACHGFAFFPSPDGNPRSEIFVMVMPLCFENLRQRCVCTYHALMLTRFYF